MRYKDLNNSIVQKVPSTSNSKLSRGKRSNLSYNLTGMPPGGVAIVYDKLHQIFELGKYKTKSIGTFVVNDEGVLFLKNLRDSVYSVQFQNIEHLLYNISELSVGDSNLFNTILEGEIPYPVIITGIVNGLNIDDQAFLTIYWTLDSHKIDGYYEVWVKSELDSGFLKHTTVYEPQTRFFNIVPLEYGLDYQIKVRTINQEGLHRGYSNTVSGTTVSNPFSSGVLDTTSPTGAIFYY